MSVDKAVVPFQAVHSVDDGFFGGEVSFNLEPSQNNNASWIEHAEIKSIQVNCARLIKTWENDESKGLYQVIIKLKQKLCSMKKQVSGNKLLESDHSTVNKLTQDLEVKDKKVVELKEKNKKLVAENNELKTLKKNVASHHGRKPQTTKGKMFFPINGSSLNSHGMTTCKHSLPE